MNETRPHCPHCQKEITDRELMVDLDLVVNLTAGQRTVYHSDCWLERDKITEDDCF